MQEEWKWFGNAAHFIGAKQCRFHLATQVGKFIISTVGEYVQNNETEEFKTLGIEPKSYYETIVFEIKGYCECGCGLPEANVSKDPDGLDMERYSTAKEANEGHLKYCLKYNKLEE